MRQNKNRKNVKTKASPAVEDALLLKKLPRLLALCEFVLIPFLVASPLVSLEHHLTGDTLENVEMQKDGVLPQKDVQPLMEAPATDSISGGEVRIATATESILEPKEVMQVTVTAYSSTPDQTDATPFHTANGNEVQDGIVAANFLPLGTRVRIPEIFGDKIFTVLDRMHERFDQRLDIWMPTREAAQEFGIQYLKLEILP